MDRKITGISVIVCCYNSALRLPETLAHLAVQTVRADTLWEVILVNNNSIDDTENLAKSLWYELDTPVPLKIVKEPNAGLSFAREKGISASKYNLYLFCDDDNWLQYDYLQTAIETFNTNPEIGALGGWSTPVFEGEKPEWFDTFSGNFAAGKPVKESGIITMPQAFLYGAGMVIHQETFSRLQARGFKSILTDRKGTQLSSGGDVELIYAIKLLGIPVMFSDGLCFQHFMPKERMEWAYLLRLRNSMQWSNFVLHIYIDALKNTSLTVKNLFKKAMKAIHFIYVERNGIHKLTVTKRLFLENQIAIRCLFLKHFMFYYKTRQLLKNIQND
tara:strand:+ start:13603 stop:14595 length:993 start_codon:yes stop_codon:yes gene_type:complete